MKIGDLRLKEFTHPDSINVTVWDVEIVKLATGKYAEEGQTYWGRVTLEPFTDRQEAILAMAKLAHP